jgi:hypothetical protein
MKSIVLSTIGAAVLAVGFGFSAAHALPASTLGTPKLVGASDAMTQLAQHRRCRRVCHGHGHHRRCRRVCDRHHG